MQINNNKCLIDFVIVLFYVTNVLLVQEYKFVLSQPVFSLLHLLTFMYIIIVYMYLFL